MLKLLFCLGQIAVFELGSLLEVIALLGGFDLTVQALNAFTQLLYAADGVLFVLPLGFHGVEILAVFGQLLLQIGQTRLGQLVILIFERSFFDLHLDDPAAHHIQLRRHRIHLGADHGARLVDEVNCLVGQIPVGNIAVRERRGSNDGRIRDFHAVEHLIALLEATQNGNGVLHCRLLHEHGLEPPLKRGVLFDILPVFIECRCADAVQLAAREHRL